MDDPRVTCHATPAWGARVCVRPVKAAWVLPVCPLWRETVRSLLVQGVMLPTFLSWSGRDTPSPLLRWGPVDGVGRHAPTLGDRAPGCVWWGWACRFRHLSRMQGLHPGGNTAANKATLEAVGPGLGGGTPDLPTHLSRETQQPAPPLSTGATQTGARPEVISP